MAVRTVTHRPAIIQGGMGVAVSGWRLARAVSRAGQLGVVSGTALDMVLARRLQLGDRDVRRAIEAFPDRDVAARILADYFVEGGISDGQPFKGVPVFAVEPRRRSLELATMGGFVEVWLAKEGHDGIVGINFLEKIQLPTPPTLYGAMLAGVDAVLVGAGIPREIPGLLDGLAGHDPVSLPLHVAEGDGDKVALAFDPRSVVPAPGAPLARPMFLAIIASTALAISLARKTPGVDGFVVEGPTAGGHNAPPRGAPELVDGEPVYGPRDDVDLEKVSELGLPFWLAGGQATPKRLRDAQEAGAAGIQVGTVFAFCEDSGMAPSIRARVLEEVAAGRVSVFTDPLASPTGFPFKVVQLDGTLSEDAIEDARERTCDLGYLREVYVTPEGALGYRCPAEPVDDYVRKGGDLAETVGRKCICNGLTATVGLGQRRAGVEEPPIVTAGDDLEDLGRLRGPDRCGYTAAEVVAYLLGEPLLAEPPSRRDEVVRAIDASFEPVSPA